MARFVRNRFFVLAVVAGLTLFGGALPAWANAVPVPISIGAHSSVPAGLQSVVTFDARGAPAAANAGYYSRPVLVSNNTLGGLANGLLRRAVPVAAMVLAVEAAGWAIDELTKQVKTKPEGTAPVVGDGVWCNSDLGCAADLQSFVGKSLPWGNGSDYTITGHSQFYAGYLQVNGGAVGGTNAQFRPYAVNDPWLGFSPATLVALADLGQLIKDDPALWKDALTNADGSVNRNPDVNAAAQALAAELAAPAPAPAPDPTAEWDTGLQGGDAPPAAGTDFELPAFCTWAAVVCDAVTFFMDDQDDAPADTPLDWIDPEAAVSWSSGLGGGSCPADVSASLPFGGDITFPMGQFCDLADLIRPLVLLAAALAAAMIIGGARNAS